MGGDGEQTKARLLAAARDLFLEEGPARFSLREVARRAKVSPAAVYRHFDSREALLAAVSATGFEIFLGHLVRALAAPSSKDRIVASARHYLRFGLESPRDYRFIFMGSAADYGAKPGDRARAPAFQFLVDRVRECMHDGVLAKRDPEPVATSIWAHVHGLTSLRLAGQLDGLGDDEAFAKHYDRSVARMLRGLAK
jgi:AcrR family transcriptional regulator